MNNDDRSGRLATIRGLLFKAESTPYPEEAEAFLAKATELMSRHSISEALVWADDPSIDRPSEITLTLQRPFLPQKAVLVASVAEALGCRSLRLEGLPGGRELISVVGFGRDLELVETLVTSLMVQLATALAASTPTTGSAAATASWRRSFICGFTETVSARLAADRRRAAESASGGPGWAGSRSTAPGTEGSAATPSAAVVLADRAESVDDEWRTRYPHVRVSRVSAGRSAAGRAAGATEGNRADLGRGQVRSPLTIER